MKIRKNEIFIGNISVQELAQKYGTPIYVYDEEKIRANFKRCYEAFSKRYPNFRIFYAVKSNTHPAILRMMKQLGAGADCAAPFEIQLAKKMGFSPTQILFSGNYCSDADLSFALKEGVHINLDDASLLPRLLRFGKPPVLSFRINSGYGQSSVAQGLITAGPHAKFGVPVAKVKKAYQAAIKAGIRKFGVHMMTGSCVLDPHYFSSITATLLDIVGKLAKALHIHFEFIDIGGGLGIPYRPGEKELDIEKTANLVVKTFKKKIHQYGLTPPRLVMEPGRYFVGNAGYIVSRVQAIKKGYKTFVGLDAGMNHLLRPALYDAYHNIRVEGRSGRKTVVDVCGQICENTDILAKDRPLPMPKIGDLVVIENAGAYGFDMSFPYNGRPRAAQVLVKGNQSFLIREAENFDDLLRGIHIPKHLE